MDRPATYFQFPLFLLRHLFTKKEATLNKIIYYGLYQYSKTVEWELDEVIFQMMYCYHRNKILSELKRKLEQYKELSAILEEENKSRFYDELSDDGYEDHYSVFYNLFKRDPAFKELAILQYQLKQSFSFIGVKGGYDTIMPLVAKIEKLTPPKEPFPMINKDLLFKFRDNEKTEFELVQLAMYIAIRSILGKKRMCKTNKALVISRMFGYSKPADMPFTLEEPLKTIYNKYIVRYQFDKLKEEMQLYWHVKMGVVKTRGFFIGCGKNLTSDELALYALKSKRSKLVKALKAEKIAAHENAQKKLDEG